MKAKEFKEQNLIIAEDQKEYENLPAFAQQNGILTYCMELTDEEIKKTSAENEVNITVLNFGGPVQPMAVSVHKPKFPVLPNIKTESNAKTWELEAGTATFHFPLSDHKLKTLKKTKLLWVTVVTFGKPLQPIRTES